MVSSMDTQYKNIKNLWTCKKCGNDKYYLFTFHYDIKSIDIFRICDVCKYKRKVKKDDFKT